MMPDQDKKPSIVIFGRCASAFGFGVAVTLVGGIVQLPFLVVAGLIVVGSAILTNVFLARMMFGGQTMCNGKVDWVGSDENEVYIGTCNACDRWTIKVRGNYVANGKGYPEFTEAAEDIASRYESHVPAIANEFRQLLARLND